MPESYNSNHAAVTPRPEISPLKYKFKFSLKTIPHRIEPRHRRELLLAHRLKGLSLKGVSSQAYSPTTETHLLRAIRSARQVPNVINKSSYMLTVTAKVPVLRDVGFSQRIVMEEIKEHLNYETRPNLKKLKEGLIYLNCLMRERVQRARRGLREVRMTGVRTEWGYFERQFKRKKYAKVMDDKQPTDRRKHVAVEIECLSKVPHEDLAGVIVDSGISQYVTLKHDGSLRPSNSTTPYKYNAELVVCTPREEFEESIIKLTRAIAPYVVVNKSCGLHVHFDMRSFPVDNRYPIRDTVSAEAAYRRLYMCQSILMGMQPASRRDNQYCRRNRYSDFWQAKRHDNRYHVINTQSMSRHHTLEVRVHSGTVDALKIINWVRLLEAKMKMKEDKITSRAISSLNTFAKLGLPSHLVEYAKARTALFAEPSSTDSENEGATPVAYDARSDFHLPAEATSEIAATSEECPF